MRARAKARLRIDASTSSYVRATIGGCTDCLSSLYSGPEAVVEWQPQHKIASFETYRNSGSLYVVALHTGLLASCRIACTVVVQLQQYAISSIVTTTLCYHYSFADIALTP